MKSLHSAVVAFLLVSGASVSAGAFTPQVCRGYDEGYEVYTDCYGMTLTGQALEAARVRELVSMNMSPAEIAEKLGVRVAAIRSAQPTCPRGATYVASEKASDGPGYIVRCVQ